MLQQLEQQEQQQFGQALSMVLQRLTQLAELTLSQLPAAVIAAGLQGTPDSLRTLQVIAPDGEDVPYLPPRLGNLPTLHRLSLRSASYDPSALAGMTQLQELELQLCHLHQAGGGMQPAVAEDAPADGVRQTLLGALAHLTNLRDLHLQVRRGFCRSGRSNFQR